MKVVDRILTGMLFFAVMASVLALPAGPTEIDNDRPRTGRRFQRAPRNKVRREPEETERPARPSSETIH